MRKLLTIDCWNTLLKSSASKEDVLLNIASRLGLYYTDFKRIVDEVTETIGNDDYLTPNKLFWYLVKEKGGYPISLDKLCLVANAAYKEYVPQFPHKTEWITLMSLAWGAGFDIKILTNTGYLKSDWLDDYFQSEVGFHGDMAVIGSDTVGFAKPDPMFYKVATDDIVDDGGLWIHIGDSLELDVNPVTQLGGNAIHYQGPQTLQDKTFQTLVTELCRD